MNDGSSPRQVQDGALKSDLLVLVLADDLTGALEVGARLAARGIAVRVATGEGTEFPASDETTQALVIDTETRHLPADSAAEKVYRLACAARKREVRCLFKKTDSTLRGNIGSELQALLRAFPGLPLVYAPAYPQLGRTVRDGVLHIDGMPVSETAFAADPLDPVRESHIPVLLRRAGCPVAAVVRKVGEIVPQPAPGIYLVDGEEEEDLRDAARDFVATGHLRLAAGPAAFADHLARLIVQPGKAGPVWPAIQSCLVVNGSVHEASLRQIRHAKESGWCSCGPEELQRRGAGPGWILLDLPEAGGLAGLQLAARIGKIVNRLLASCDFDAVVVFGGDTAYGVLRAVGEPTLHPVGEVLPGVPLSRIGGGGRVRHLITKAGGFGAPDLLPTLKMILGDP